jgi:hypothetical protein
MTTRRDLLRIAGGVVATTGAAALTGCRDERTRNAVAVPDVVVADSRQGLVVLGGARPRGFGMAATVSADGGLVSAVIRDKTGRATLEQVDPAVGVPARSLALGGGWVPRVISEDGRSCALSRTPATTIPAGRAGTALLVTTEGQQRRYDLEGVIEPDAFTRDGLALFVLEWLPASAPDRYRVRLLDLTSGEVGPLLTRAKAAVPPGAEEEMRGEGRQAVLSPDRQVLYTLYTHQPGHRHTRDLIAGRPGNVHAFVHVLHLNERWAYCLDLPDPFGTGPAAGHAVAVSADGGRLAVVDVLTGHLAYADTTALTIERVAAVPAAEGAASLVFAPDGMRVFVGAGPELTVLDRSTDAVTARWPVAGSIRGLGLSRDGARVYAGGADEVVWLDAATGRPRGQAPVDGLIALRHVR